MIALLRYLDGLPPYTAETPADIASALGFSTSGPTGRAARSFSPAQRIIGTLVALSRRGYVALGRRRDGRSGTAYRITDEGRAALRAVSEEIPQKTLDRKVAPFGE
jgi:hypothetical protein